MRKNKKIRSQHDENFEWENVLEGIKREKKWEVMINIEENT